MKGIVRKSGEQSVREPALARFAQQVRANERIWGAFRRIELRMLDAPSVRAFVSVLSVDLPRSFPHVHAATLTCVDPEYEFARLCARELEPDLPDGALISVEPRSYVQVFGPAARPFLGASSPSLQREFFPGMAAPIGSVALAPLLRDGKLIGSLNQASLEPRHFGPEVATDLLEHLAAVAAMCLENLRNQERLRLDGLTDAVTEVPNRRFFDRRLAEETERWQRRDEPLAMILVDIDHFKQVNDCHGHQAGDSALAQVARWLGEGLRACDVLARFGGEEFVLLLPNTTAHQAGTIAERLRERIAHASINLDDGGEGFKLTASFGVAALEEKQGGNRVDAANGLLRRADRALYAAKAAGRNCVVNA
jgi:two-component system cell cycle response regulator